MKKQKKQKSPTPLSQEELCAIIARGDCYEIATALEQQLRGKEHSRVKALLPDAFSTASGQLAAGMDVALLLMKTIATFQSSSLQNKVAPQKLLLEVLRGLVQTGKCHLSKDFQLSINALVRHMLGVSVNAELLPECGPPAMEFCALVVHAAGLLDPHEEPFPAYGIRREEIATWVLCALQQSRLNAKPAAIILADLKSQDYVSTDMLSTLLYIPLLEEDLNEVCVRFAGEDHSRRSQLVAAMAQLQKDKAASRMIAQWGYDQSEFPVIARMRKQAALTWAIAKKELDVCIMQLEAADSGVSPQDLEELGLWACQRAISHHGEEDSFTGCLVARLGLAIDFPAVAPPPEGDPAAQAKEGFVDIATVLDLSQVFVVTGDNLELLAQARETLLAEKAIGVDVEWKPVMRKGQPQRCALLQLAGRHSVFLFDLLDGISVEMDQVLQDLWNCETAIKVGFAICGDFRQLSQAFPESQAMRQVLRYVDFEVSIIDALQRDAVRQGVAADLTSGRGLSALSHLVLGLPLDKSARMSNWEERPLRPQQLHYAALDAWVPMLCLHRLLEDERYAHLPIVQSLRAQVSCRDTPFPDADGLVRRWLKS